MKTSPTIANAVALPPTWKPGISESSETVRALLNAVSVAVARTPWTSEASGPSTRSGATEIATNSRPISAPATLALATKKSCAAPSVIAPLSRRPPDACVRALRVVVFRRASDDAQARDLSPFHHHMRDSVPVVRAAGAAGEAEVGAARQRDGLAEHLRAVVGDRQRRAVRRSDLDFVGRVLQRQREVRGREPVQDVGDARARRAVGDAGEVVRRRAGALVLVERDSDPGDPGEAEPAAFDPERGRQRPARGVAEHEGEP